MERKRIIVGAATRMENLAEGIANKYTKHRYQVQKMHFDDKDGMVVQICNSKSNAWGTAKTLLGCKTCASLILLSQGNDLKIEVVQGRWLDKGVAIAFGAFVAFGVLVFTGAFGICRQIKLLDDVFNDAESLAIYGN